MELIISFKKESFLPDGTHVKDGRLVMELQKDWEEEFHNKFNPFYANVIEAHPIAMNRLTQYYECDEKTNYEFGMELIDGEIDLDTNLAIEDYIENQTVFAIGSQLHNDEDDPLFLILNDKLKMDILVFKYEDENSDEVEFDNEPVLMSIDIETQNKEILKY